MASFKIMLIEHKRRADKTYPLAMRITADRLSKYIYMNVYLLADQWDESNQKVRKNHPNATLINTFLQDKLLEAQKVYLNQEVRKKSTTTGELKKRIKNQRTGTTFFQFAQDYLDMLSTAGKIKVYKSDNSRINNFKEFRKSEDLHFEDVTTELLKQFISWLQGKKESKPRSIVNHLILIRTLYNKAIGDNIVEQNYYPFGRGKLTIRIPESQKIGLNEDEIKKIENLDLSKNPNLKHARNVFLVSFYLAGIRIGDLLRLKWADFKNGRLHYIMGKNNKPGSIKINEKVMEILAQYEPDKPSPKALVFPDLTTANVKDPVDLERKVNTATKNLNTRLKKIATLATIDKNMFNHIARHSFGNIAGDKIPLPVLKNLYRHSSIITTANYQQSFTKGC
ncbi:MAG TPA: site-specific integrase [Bacteroidales bacterium]|nr:site-specific integrase [Bacteroidales bacterium]